MLNLEEGVCAIEVRGYSILVWQQAVGWDPAHSELSLHRKPVCSKWGGGDFPLELVQKVYPTLLMVLETDAFRKTCLQVKKNWLQVESKC